MRLKATYEQRRAFQQAMSSMLKSIPEGGFSAESKESGAPRGAETGRGGVELHRDMGPKVERGDRAKK